MVLDPFDLAPGLPELVWDPVVGCEDPMTAERRAKAFAAGTVGAASTMGAGDQAARFYAAEAAKVLQAYLHAAALDGCSLDVLLKWVANPRRDAQAEEILRLHPRAAPFWDGLLRGALHGDERTAGNTITTLQQALGLFFQTSIRRRCTPSPGRPATDLADVIRRGGTVYLLGREDPYASASPLMTAVAEHVLDTALAMAMASVQGRLCPPFLACLDELPSTTPLPTLAHADGERTGPRVVVCLRRADLAPARRLLRRGRGALAAGAEQQPGRLRWRQGRGVLPGRVGPARRDPGQPGAATSGAGTVGARRGRRRTYRSCARRRSGGFRTARRWWCRSSPHRWWPPWTVAWTGVGGASWPARSSAPARSPGRPPRPRGTGDGSRRGAVSSDRVGTSVTAGAAGFLALCQFPTPSAAVTAALDELQLASLSDPASRAELRRIAELPRPWDPAACPPVLRAEVFDWLARVATWINEQQLWNLGRPGIPPCWPAHPHLVHDLAVVACARLFALYGTTPAAMLEWHQYTLPAMLERLADRLGDACAPGRHEESPRAGRDRLHREQRFPPTPMG